MAEKDEISIFSDTEQAVVKKQTATQERIRVVSELNEVVSKATNASPKEKEAIFAELMKMRLPDIDQLNATNDKDLSNVMIALQNLFAGLGNEISLKEDYTNEEKNTLSAMEEGVKKMEQKLVEAQAVTDNGWNRFWGREKSIEKAKTNLELAKSKQDGVKLNIETSRRTRLKNATVSESGKRLLSYINQAIKILVADIQANEKEYEVLDILRILTAKEAKEQSAELEKRTERRDKLEIKLAEAGKALLAIADQNSPEHGEQAEIVSNIQEEFNEAVDMVKATESEVRSRQTYLPNIMGRMTAQSEQTGNLNSLRVRLEVMAETVVKLIQADLRLRQNAQIQESGSAILDVGMEFIKEGLRTATKIASASGAKYLEQVQSDPKNILESYAYAQALEEVRIVLKEKADEIRNASSFLEAKEIADKQRGESGESNMPSSFTKSSSNGSEPRKRKSVLDA